MQIDVAVDGEVEVSQLNPVAAVIEDEVLVQPCVGFTQIEVSVCLSVDGLLTCRLHAGPVAIEVVDVAPHVERQGVPSGIVEDKDGETVVLHFGLGSHLLDPVGCDAQIDVAVDGEVEVSQLDPVAAVVEDEVLVQPGIGCPHVEVFPGDAVLAPGPCHRHAWPVAIQVIDVAPHVERQYVPAGLVVHIYCEAVVLRLWRLASGPVVAFPSLPPYIGERAYGGAVVVDRGLALDGELHTLLGRVEAEAVGQAFACHETGRVEIDAPLDVALGRLGQQILLLSDGCTVAIEGADDIDILVSCRAERGNKLQQDTVSPRLKLLTLVVENDVFFI